MLRIFGLGSDARIMHVNPRNRPRFGVSRNCNVPANVVKFDSIRIASDTVCTIFRKHSFGRVTRGMRRNICLPSKKQCVCIFDLANRPLYECILSRCICNVSMSRRGKVVLTASIGGSSPVVRCDVGWDGLWCK